MFFVSRSGSGQLGHNPFLGYFLVGGPSGQNFQIRDPNRVCTCAGADSRIELPQYANRSNVLKAAPKPLSGMVRSGFGVGLSTQVLDVVWGLQSLH